MTQNTNTILPTSIYNLIITKPMRNESNFCYKKVSKKPKCVCWI